MSDLVAIFLALISFSMLISPPKVEQENLGSGLNRAHRFMIGGSALMLVGLTVALLGPHAPGQWVAQHKIDIMYSGMGVLLLAAQCYRVACESLVNELIAFSSMTKDVLGDIIADQKKAADGK